MSKTYPFFITTFFVLLSLFASACAQATPTPIEIPPSQTSQSIEFLDLSKITPATENPSNVQKPTGEPTPTFTPHPTSTSIPVVISTKAKSGCINQAEFVKHLMVSENTAIKPGEYFVKIWQIINTGTCSWDTNYHLVWIGGESMQAPSSIQIPHEVKPQETVDLRVNLIAPETPNFYENSWMLQDPDGNYFGFGPNHDQPLYVKIEVPLIFKPKPL